MPQQPHSGYSTGKILRPSAPAAASVESSALPDLDIENYDSDADINGANELKPRRQVLYEAIFSDSE